MNWCRDRDSWPLELALTRLFTAVVMDDTLQHAIAVKRNTQHSYTHTHTHDYRRQRPACVTSRSDQSQKERARERKTQRLAEASSAFGAIIGLYELNEKTQKWNNMYTQQQEVVRCVVMHVCYVSYLRAVFDVMALVEAQVAQVVGWGSLIGLSWLWRKGKVWEMVRQGVESIHDVIQGAIGWHILIYVVV